MADTEGATADTEADMEAVSSIVAIIENSSSLFK